MTPNGEQGKNTLSLLRLQLPASINRWVREAELGSGAGIQESVLQVTE
jgi:hypothetical protein